MYFSIFSCLTVGHKKQNDYIKNKNIQSQFYYEETLQRYVHNNVSIYF